MESVSTQKNTTKGITRLLSQSEAAEILGVKPDTLCYWRSTGRYRLPYVKVGRLVKYCPKDIEKFVAERTVIAEEGV